MIDIVVSNGISYVWDPKDWKQLRTEHRIIGQFDGALHVSGTEKVTLPLRLSTVETQYLLKHRIARTVESPKLYHRKGFVEREKFLERRNAHKTEQLAQFKKTKRVELEAMVDKIIEGKRNKGRLLIPDREAVIHDELEKICSLPYEMIEVDMRDPWTQEEHDLQPSYFPEPNSEHGTLRLDVFEDFCSRRGYFLTVGTSFGGDFLAYPGDPVEYHSEFIIICRPSGQATPKMSLISQQRLAQTVKKTLLIAFHDEGGQLKYERIVGSHTQML